ncbi:MAG: sulfite exporter TauE/SafE family protein [Patescibacteria group bacterium]
MHNQKNTLNLNIRGMHCKSCEMLIEDHVGKVPGVTHVKVDHRTGHAEIAYAAERQPASQALEDAVQTAGYSVGDAEAQPFMRLSPQDYRDLSVAALVLMGAYFLIKYFGLANLNIVSPSSTSGAAMPLLVGLTAGFSTCMALVGGLVLSISARHAEKHPEATPAQKFRPHIYFNLGRIASYIVLGGALGALGSVFQLSGLTLGLLTLFVGLVMLVMGLQLLDIFPWVEKLKLVLPKSLARWLGVGRHEKEYSHKNSMYLGAATFFLPCGFTQAMQLFAVSTGSLVKGATIMGLFALGTAPGLLGVGGLTSLIKGAFARKFFKFAGLAVIALAVFNLQNGWRLTGWGTGAEASVVRQDPDVTLENGVQVARMTQSSSGYAPSSFTVRKGVPVKWIIDATDPYSCSSSIVLSAMGIRKNLAPGENVIEFTPDKVGTLRFTCSMGMYVGSFNVIDGQTQSAGPIQAAQAATVPQGKVSCGGGSGCGGCGGGAKPQPATTGSVAPSGDDANSTQVIKADYTLSDDIVPNTFTVKAGVPVRFEVTPKDNGSGCMSTILIPGLYDTPTYLEAGKVVVMEFTPRAGTYQITCAMGVPRGTIIAQ